MIDCHTREMLGWQLWRPDKAKTAAMVLEPALITRFSALGRGSMPFLLQSSSGLVFISRSDTALVRSYGLKQESITPHCPKQNGMVERVIRTMKEQCVHRLVSITCRMPAASSATRLAFIAAAARTKRSA